MDDAIFRTADCYEIEQHIGEGTFGQVFMGRDKTSGETVALKKVKLDQEKEGFPITAIREVKILRQLDHPNVINLKEIVTSGTKDESKSIYMVFEYMEHDLTGLLETPSITFTTPQIKCYLAQLLQGLQYCHANHILHRDVKGSNLLISNNGVLKLADFGLARSYVDQQGHLTNRVITLWYRAPELLLGSQEYDTAIDMWSVGCIFAELLSRKPLFQGRRERDQLEKIVALCGSPTHSDWPNVEASANYSWVREFGYGTKRRVRDKFKECERMIGALDLLDGLLTLNPKHRLSASAALHQLYFKAEPRAAKPEECPKYETHLHEFHAKKKRKELAGADAAGGK